MFDQLVEARSVARARAVEDFAYFVHAVLGLRLDTKWCQSVQEKVEAYGVCTVLHEKQRSADAALLAWLVVLGLRDEKILAPTETFEWLFAEHCMDREKAA